MMERRFFRTERSRALTVVLLVIGLFCGRPLLAVDWVASAGEAGHKVVPLSHISPEKGKEFLTRLKIGTANRLPGTSALLVTGPQDELQKAAAVLKVVDAPGNFDIEPLGPASSARLFPANKQIAGAVGNISIGTFAHPPQGTNQPRALIDIHNGVVIAVAPIFQLQDIKLAVELGPQVLKQRKSTSHAATAGSARPATPVSAVAESENSSVPAGQPQKVARPDAGHGNLPAPARTAHDNVILKPDLRPAVASLLPKPASRDLSFLQADGRITGPNVPSPLQKPDIERDLAPQPEELPESLEPVSSEPVPSEPVMLEPGQRVPSEEAPTVVPPMETESAIAKPEPPMEPDVASEPNLAAPQPEALSYGPGQFSNGEELIDLTLPPTVPVIQLLDLVGKYLNLSYLYDPAKVTGEVTLKLNGGLSGKMKVKDLYQLLESVLQFKNLVMTRHKGNIVKIVPVTEFTSLDPDLVDPNRPTVDAGDVVITRVFELEHVDTSSAENLLTGMGLTVGVTSIAESGTLIVTAYAHRMGRIEHLLAMVDKPGKPREFKFRQLKYTMAKTLAEKVQALAEQLESVTVTVAQQSSTTTPTTKIPGESEAAYRTRVARLKAAQAARQRATASRAAATKPEEQKAGVYLDADERTNRILMIGAAEQLEVVEDLVDALDVEQQDLRSLKLYRIRQVDAEEVAKKLQELGIISRAPESEYASSRISQTQPQTAAQRAQAARQAATQSAAATTGEVTEQGLVEEPQVVVVESTNSLLVNATQEQHNQIETIIGYVDTEMDEEEIPYKIYPLENSGPSHLAEILESLIQETVEDKEGKVEKIIKKEEEITIVPDPNTYSLIVYASKKNQDWIENLVQQLDKRRPQVLIDVTLVEITKTDAFTYDLNLIHSFPDLISTSGLTGVITEGKATADIIDQLASSDRTQFADWQSDSGSLTAFYGDKHVNALLKAVQSKNYGRVLAKPKILVNDNEPGTIKTTDTTYVKKTSSIPVSSGGAGQDTTLIQTAEDYTPYEAGITLDITPHISEGDLLRLDIALTRSDFLEITGDSPPNTTASEVTTAVTVPDGSTVILGGLLKLNQNKGGDKVPLLGDIPIIGGLFRGISNSDRQSKLYVFVKAEIIRPAAHVAQGMEDLEQISERNRMAFEKHEMEFQGYENWPGIKPRPVSPAKVLDAQ